MGGTTICKVQLTFSCILTGYETKQKCDLLNSATRDTLISLLYSTKVTRMNKINEFTAFDIDVNV